jgi:hypothetical protein
MRLKNRSLMNERERKGNEIDRAVEHGFHARLRSAFDAERVDEVRVIEGREHPGDLGVDVRLHLGLEMREDVLVIGEVAA